MRNEESITLIIKTTFHRTPESWSSDFSYKAFIVIFKAMYVNQETAYQLIGTELMKQLANVFHGYLYDFVLIESHFDYFKPIFEDLKTLWENTNETKI